MDHGETIALLLGNQAAFKGFLRRRLPSDAAAEDLLQQGLLKAIRSSEGLTPKESVTAWFYRILRNSLTDYYRMRAAEGRKIEGAPAPGPAGTPEKPGTELRRLHPAWLPGLHLRPWPGPGFSPVSFRASIRLRI
jgi:DNA-directed RNA polymerase specialized sigma24 family protein